MKAQFGNQNFEFGDVWPSMVQKPSHAIKRGIDAGSTYLSFPLTEEQKRFLGNTDATHLRLQVKKV